jgi:crotonobetainyl-CoA:carnitine CoA-transferase CaiB-like acyl-CoA transferase
VSALEGLRILDMTQYEAGPSCTQALAWMGADVVKVESTTIGDPGRSVAADSQYSAYFCNWNANKKSVALDLKKPEARDLLLRMVPGFDVFVENYGPGVVEKFDLTYEHLKAVHPGIIYAQVKGFGLSGPYAEYKSYDMIAQAAAGAFSLTGFADGPPICPGPTTGDSGTGMQLGMAILAAYIQRLRTGEGQHIEISMQEAMTYFMRTRLSFASNFGRDVAPRTGNGLGPPTNLYATRPFGPNDYVYVICVTTRHWDSLCLGMGRADLITDPRFDTGLARLQNGDELFEEIAGWMREHTKYDVMHLLGKAGVPCSAVLDSVDLHDDPHLNERGFVHTIDHPEHGEVRLLGWAPRMSASPVTIERAPLLGEHTEEVLAAEAGVDAGQVKALREAGIAR